MKTVAAGVQIYHT